MRSILLYMRGNSSQEHLLTALTYIIHLSSSSSSSTPCTRTTSTSLTKRQAVCDVLHDSYSLLLSLAANYAEQ